MRPLFAVVTAIVCLACGSAPSESGDSHGEAPGQSQGDGGGGGAGGDGGAGGHGGECSGDVVETILPGQAGVKVVTLCKACDRGCDDAGDPCDKYGAACDFSGKRGVCGACCDGEQGKLRCYPID